MTSERSFRSANKSIALIPARIAGRYEPLAKIAAGGMATVYLARAITGAGFGKLVALKCVHPHMADDPEFVEMFLDEARISSRIDHPNVCNVFDAGEDDGTHYIAMEYLHGEPLSALIKHWDKFPDSRPSTHVELCARIIADAAMGLHAAHEVCGADGESLGLVHRDISPQNLFLTYAGAVKVVDFGIAKAAGRLHETTTGVVKGKLAYMSPEQLHAKPLDRRSDVWALGVTLWELLAGRRLFRRGDQIETLNAVLESRVPLPSEIDPNVSGALEAIVMRALRRERAHRQSTARELADELNDFLASHRAPMGMSQLADLMTSSFPDRIEEKDRWVRKAQQDRPVEQLSASEPPVEHTVSEVRPTQMLTHTDPVELPVRRAAGGLVAAGALALLAAGVAGWFMLDDEEAASRAGSGSASLGTQEAAPPEPMPTGADVPDEPLVAPLPVEPGRSETEGEREPRRRSRPRHARRPPPFIELLETETTGEAPPLVEPAVEPARPEQPARRHSSPRPMRIVHPGGGWALVRVDGRDRGTTPTTVPGVSVGDHLIELRPYARGPWVRHPVEVPAGDGAFTVRERLPAP